MTPPGSSWPVPLRQAAGAKLASRHPWAVQVHRPWAESGSSRSVVRVAALTAARCRAGGAVAVWQRSWVPALALALNWRLGTASAGCGLPSLCALWRVQSGRVGLGGRGSEAGRARTRMATAERTKADRAERAMPRTTLDLVLVTEPEACLLLA